MQHDGEKQEVLHHVLIRHFVVPFCASVLALLPASLLESATGAPLDLTTPDVRLSPSIDLSAAIGVIDNVRAVACS